MLKGVIIDDDPLSRELLNDVIVSNYPQVQIVGQAGNAKEGEALITEHHPNIVFLDVEMPDESGFELIDRLGEIDYFVVFVTMYPHYAVEAFDSPAIDFIVKPIDEVRLAKTFTKIMTQQQLIISRFQNNDQLNSVINNKAEQQKVEKILVPQQGGLKIIATKNIIKLEGDNNYTTIHTTEGKKVLASKTLKHFDEVLKKDYRFMRIYKSYIVNLGNVQEIVRDGYTTYAKLNNGELLNVSRNKKDELKEKLENYSE